MSKRIRALEWKEIPPQYWDRVRLEEILLKFRGKKILVVGDVGIDRYTIGTVERISPEAPVPIVFVEEEKHKLGLAANVADNVAVLGGVPLLVGVIGKDRGAEDFRRLLKESGIQSKHLVPDTSRRTVLKERVVSERQQLLRIDYENSHTVDPVMEKTILKRIRSLLPTVDAVIMEDYAKGTLTPTLMKSIFDVCKKAKKLIAVDPNIKTVPAQYRGASILTPNTKEAEHLSGVLIRDEISLKAAGLAILKLTSAQYVIITRGKDGMAIFGRAQSSMCLIPTCAREVYDVSGAGDTVISAIALAMVSGASIEEASILGNLAAGIEVGKRGTATVTPDEIRGFLDLLAQRENEL